MKNTLLAIIMVMAACAGVAEGANRLYIVPADENGNIVKDSTGYVGQVEMIQEEGDENVYGVKDVDVPSGMIALYGLNEYNGRYTFYGVITWAVSPVPVNYPSPLVIDRDNAVINLPSGGTYDFEFYDRDIEGIAYHMLIPRPVSADNDMRYPERLFLIDSGNQYVELQGNPATGIYQGEVKLPDDFRISYEPRFDMGVFIFGPASGSGPSVTLHDGERVPIAYAVNPDAVFEVDKTGRTSDYSKVTADLAEGYLLVNEDIYVGVESFTQDVDSKIMQYFTLSGQRLGSRPAAGPYILRQGANSVKVIR